MDSINPEIGQVQVKSSKNDPSNYGKRDSDNHDIRGYRTRSSKRQRTAGPEQDDSPADETAGTNQDQSEEHAKTSETNCENCHENFSDKSLLLRHWYRAHKTYHCKLCQISFKGIRNGCKHYNPNFN